MQKSHYQKSLLTQAVLASTLFLSPLSFATVVNAPNTQAPVLTSIGGDIQILTTGSIGGTAISDNKDGAVIDTAAGKLLIDANNVNPFAIQTTGATTVVAAIAIEDPNASVIIGSNSVVNGASTKTGSDAIIINNAATASIVNAGTISNTGAGSEYGIELFGASPNATITNQSGGLISTGPTVLGATIQQTNTSPGLKISNAGTIQQAAPAFNTLSLGGSISEFTNKSGGLITQIGGGPAAAVVLIAGGGGSDINNNAGATISATKAGVVGITIVNNPFTGSIINAGSILTQDNPALSINQNVSGAINNSGTISTATPGTATITAANIIIKGGIINSGQIESHNANPAIDLKTNTTLATFTQNAGAILGNVLLAAGDSTGVPGLLQNVFQMNDGTITGNVLASTFLGNSNLITLAGGTIAGKLTLGDNGDRVDLSGTEVTGAITGGLGNDIVNVTGSKGNFGFLEGGAGNNTLNVLTTFTPNGAINNFGSINVSTQGTILTLINPITNMNDAGLVIDAGTQVDLNANITGTGNVVNNGLLNVTATPTIDLQNTGTVTNNGITSLGNNAVLTVKSDVVNAFSSSPGGTLEVALVGLASPSGTLSNGLLNVISTKAGAVNLQAGSFVKPTVNGFIPQGASFDIVKVNGVGGTILANDTLQQPGSAVITFTQSLNGANNILSLIAARKPYEFLSSTQVTQGIAGALDALAQGNGPASQELLNLLSQLDQLGTQAQVEAAMESLAPPFNYGLIAGSHVGMDSTFNSVQLRIEDLRARRRNQQRLVSNTTPTQLAYNGLSYGDPSDSGTVWGKVLGAHLNQKERGDVAGYKAKGAGVAIGTDWGFNDCTTFGLAASYTKVNVDDKNASPKDQAIKSWQGTAYGWWEFMDGVYLDAMFGIGSNHYKTNHVINVNQLHTASQASFNGTQWGAQTDLGWALGNCESYYFAPFARLKYIHLNLDQYTENGAGDLGLTVQGNHNKEFLGGVGFRIGSTCQAWDTMLVPELSALIAYDFKNDGEQSLAGFIGGGPAFETNGIKPGRTIFNLGLGLNAHFCDESIFTVKYDLEVRSKFVGNVFYLQYNYFWS